jgi:protein-tyrosine phosphatase
MGEQSGPVRPTAGNSATNVGANRDRQDRYATLLATSVCLPGDDRRNLADVTDLNRHVSFEACFNFRDLGGYETADGAHLRWNLLYRSDALHRFTTSDADTFRALGMRTVVDLRSQTEIDDYGRIRVVDASFVWHSVPMLDNVKLALPVGTDTVRPARPVGETVAATRGTSNPGTSNPGTSNPGTSNPGTSNPGTSNPGTSNPGTSNRGTSTTATPTPPLPAGQGYYLILKQFSASVAQVFSILAADDAFPAVYHCTAGKDRTGIVSALILESLGVSDETIAEDYLLTELSRERSLAWITDNEPEFGALLRQIPPERRIVRPENILALLELIRSEHGSVRNLLHSIGVGDAQLRRIQERLVEA